MHEKLAVHCSGAFIDAFRQMVPILERTVGSELDVKQGSSIGSGMNSIPALLRREEPCDLAILFDEVADELVEEEVICRGSKRLIAKSSIGMAVREGAQLPDIATVESLRSTLLNSTSIAYSASGSGIYLATKLFPRLGVTDLIRAKCRRVVGERVASVVARGDVELGFQQMSELVTMPGIAIVGPIPDEVQHITVISAGIPRHSANPEMALRLIDWLVSDPASEILEKAGLSRPVVH